MKKRANRQNSTEQLPYAKKAYIYDDYYCYLSFKRKPVNEAYIYELAKKAIIFGDRPDSLKITDFYIEEKIDDSDVARWRKKYDFFDKALKYMKMAIGNRRERGAIKNEFNASFIQTSMPMYDDEWKALVEWREGLKSQDINVKIPDIIEIPAFEKPQEEN